MGQIYEEILPEIVSKLKIGDKENLRVLKQMGGYSGAEVYVVELKGDSIYQGVFFLKIDTEGEEYKNVDSGVVFSKVARIVCKTFINNKYILLMEIAGGSSIEYCSFYDLETPSIKKDGIKFMIPDFLREAVSKKNYFREELNASEIFRKQLNKKMDIDAPLFNYVNQRCNGKNVDIIRGFWITDEICLPNALAYATNDSLWKDTKLRNTECCIHGDFHGNNVFFSSRKKDYRMIDLAFYREDGYLFFDTAYFEISLLLNNYGQEQIVWWVQLIQRIALNQWDDIECRDAGSIEELHIAENDWIERQNDEFHSHRDGLIEAHLTARILAGLNYAGKRKIKEEVREKAFLYACVYLKRLLDLKKIEFWKDNAVIWSQIITEKSFSDETESLLKSVENFNNVQKYILLLGDNCNYEDIVYTALTRINWSGIVTFSRVEGMEKELQKFDVVNVLTTNSKESVELITSENLWYVYANGVDYDPTTITETFPQWRNQYRNFWKSICDRLDTVVAPDDLHIIVDLDSFSEIYFEHLKRLLEYFDGIVNSNINVAVLAVKHQNNEIKKDNYENIIVENYNTKLQNIALFCEQYMRSRYDDEVTVPCIMNQEASSRRKIISKSDYKFIKAYVTVLHSRILQEEGEVETKEKIEFYCGKPIKWSSIADKLYVEREEYAKYEKIIQDEIDKKDNNQFIVRVYHSPGAGATVLCRVLGWRFRNDYAVVFVERVNSNIAKCVQKLYSISGKHILLFLDGDFSENEVREILRQSKFFGAKVGIIYVCRHYDDSNNNDNMLSILSFDDGIKFSTEYYSKMQELKSYPEQILQVRQKNMNALATKQSLINYRLPFFFGINAFEDDYTNIPNYMNEIMSWIDGNSDIKKLVSYIALITYYTENEGMPLKYVKKLMGFKTKISINDLLQNLNGKIANFIYYMNGVLKVCHSVIALEILNKLYPGNEKLRFEEFLEGFVKDICACEGLQVSERLNSLLMNLFIKRDIEGDIADNFRRKNFSQLILYLDNSNLQEKFFANLVGVVPNNAHFRQHYGRLIIYNNPERLSEAKKQFDYAIELEPQNPMHYHARGNMYTKYIMHLCRNKYMNSELKELYDKIKLITDNAIGDYRHSIDLIMECNDASMDLSYPYASILITVTNVVHQLYLHSEMNIDEKLFINKDESISQWCKKMIQMAIEYDSNTEETYDLVRDNSFYNDSRKHLVKYRYSSSEIAERVDKHPGNISFMRDYLYVIDTKREKWESKDSVELERIVRCCRVIMKQSEVEVSEGLLWRWFNASIHSNNVNVIEMIAILETLNDAENNLTIQFMLYVIKLTRFLNDQDDITLFEILHHINRCKALNKNSKRVDTRFYFGGDREIAICYDREKAKSLQGTVIKWESRQNGHLSLDISPKLSAFFVPSVIGMEKEGAVGTKVQFKLGASFDGLRAWVSQ